jgi:predicted transcriptional regulator of viral defense system
MHQLITPISAAHTLIQAELYAFNSRTLSALFGLDKFQTRSLLDHMEHAGLVARIEQGKFLLLGLTPEKVLSNPLFIGCNLVAPAYVSFWSALHYHGFTEQVPRTTFVAITRRKREIDFREMHFKFVTIKPRNFFGYRRETLAELPVVIADESKAILDSLSLPQYAGGLPEVAKALQIALAQSLLDLPVLLEYAERLQNSSLSSRLGYLLESLGQATTGLEASKGPVKLDPQKPMGGEFNRRWQVYINVLQDELFPQGVV